MTVSTHRKADTRARDLELVTRWAQGDLEAGNALLTHYVGVVHRFFSNKVDAGHADLVQDTFAACTASRGRYDGRTAFRAYLLGIANKRLLMHYRGQAQRARVFAGGGSLPSVAGLLTTPSQLVAREQEQRLLLDGLRALPLDGQVLLELYYWEELSTAEIGEVLDVPVGTVKSRLAAGRAQLRAAVERLARTRGIAGTTVDGLEDWAASIRALAGPSG